MHEVASGLALGRTGEDTVPCSQGKHTVLPRGLLFRNAAGQVLLGMTPHVFKALNGVADSAEIPTAA